jgi:hypothetical protein
MAIIFSTVRNSLYTWAIANVPAGMPVIYLYANAPRPTVDYVSLYITSVTQIGRDWTQEPLTISGSSAMVGDREFTLQVQAYGGDPLTVLEGLRTSLQTASVLASLRVAGLVYVDWFPIQDTTELVDSRYENRGSLDLRWRIANVYTDSLGEIGQVIIQANFDNVNGVPIYTPILTIPP